MPMKVYLVGGAVRDALLGRPVADRDWVVVGSTADALLEQGFRPVGRDFPVFLHPATGEEYALARTERKTGPGHGGFAMYADPSVTLEDDLARRDLTINAMAQTEQGDLVDPFGGRRDLEAGILRHVSPAFVEDPLRVFRVARFAARFEFTVADETRALMQRMAAEPDELSALPAERVWQEFYKALSGPAPNRFAEVLGDANALAPWFSELAAPAVIRAELAGELARYASLGLTQPALHDLSRRLKCPRRFAALAQAVAESGDVLGRWLSEPAERVLATLRRHGLLRPESDLATALAILALRHPMDGVGPLVDRLRRAGATAAKELSGAAAAAAVEAAQLRLLEDAQRVEDQQADA